MTMMLLLFCTIAMVAPIMEAFVLAPTCRISHSIVGSYPGSSSSSLPFVLLHGKKKRNDDDDDDAIIDPDSLGDWRAFRQQLGSDGIISGSSGSTRKKSVSKENEALLESQNVQLAQEYKSGVWAHPTATPEIGGLVARLPLEVELHRNTKHSLLGKALQEQLKKQQKQTSVSHYYDTAQALIETNIRAIADSATGGQVDTTQLSDQHAELLQLYLDNQETWQEICLVIENNNNEEESDDDFNRIVSDNNKKKKGHATTLVLNRPMALKLTENLGRVLLFGVGGDDKDIIAASSTTQVVEWHKFMKAFGNECAVYIGGPDVQNEPAMLIHGVPDLPGAEEISPGIYRGGLRAAVDGVLRGKYKPLEFRFFVGRHEYSNHELDLSVVLGKYQPIACARSLALKQCISLPKPLWHEVLELCGGELSEISKREMLKRSDLQFQVIEDDDDDDGIPNELDELARFDDEELDDDDEGQHFA